MLLYRCPICKRPRRYLYPLAASMTGLVDCFGLQCQACAGLRWASQGRYRSSFERALLAAVADANGLTDYREPLPRHSWDPRAVSDPRLIADEFPDQFRRASSLQYPELVAGAGVDDPHDGGRCEAAMTGRGSFA